jgi:tetratricopeptide (TPR) repeat protein
MITLVVTLKCSTYGQDSLYAIWSDQFQSDSTRLSALQKAAWNVIHNIPDSAFNLATQQLQIAQKSGDLYWQSRAYNTIGVSYYLKNDYFKAIQHYTLSLELKNQIRDQKGAANIHENISMVYQAMGRLSESLYHIENAINIQEKLADKEALRSSFTKLGNVYFDLGEYDKALKHYMISLEMLETELDAQLIAMLFSNIGAALDGLERKNESLDWYKKSLEIRISIGDEYGIAIVHNNIASTFINMGLHDSAWYHLTLARPQLKATGNMFGLANTLFQMGQIAFEKGHFTRAIELCRESYEIGLEISAPAPQKLACYCLYRVYFEKGNFGEALKFHEKYTALSDSLQNADLLVKINNLEMERNFIRDSLNRHEERLQIEALHQRKVTGKNRQANIFLTASLVLTFLGIGLMTRSFYLRKNVAKYQNRTEMLQKQKLIGEASLLKTQVNPHFLFNSLSILSSLVHKDPLLAEQFIDQLSRSYRYILEQKDQPLVALRTELDFIKSYIFLLEIRFKNKFEVNYRFNELELDSNLIIPMTLQLLLENAVKHNKMSERLPLQVYIEIEDGYLIVRNNKQVRDSRSISTGKGLKSIVVRYSVLTQKRVEVLDEVKEFIVKVPLIPAI